MIRLVIWAGVAIALLGLFLKVTGNGGVFGESTKDAKGRTLSKAEAVRRTEEAIVRRAPVAAAALSRDGVIAYGTSFVAPEGVPAGVARLDCRGEPSPVDRPREGGCDPYRGDTSCRVVLPVACYRSSGARSPGDEANWSHGELGGTEPMMGALLKSEAMASARCEAELGAGWRMAEFHDGGQGWSLAGHTSTGLKGSARYWVHVNDQPSNCWNSVP